MLGIVRVVVIVLLSSVLFICLLTYSIYFIYLFTYLQCLFVYLLVLASLPDVTHMHLDAVAADLSASVSSLSSAVSACNVPEVLLHY